MIAERPRSLGRPLIGREVPMRGLRAAALDAVEGHGRLLLVCGEPGIGKTWLAEQLAREAPDLGLRTLWAGCSHDDGGPACWPWTQLLRAYASDYEPAADFAWWGHAGRSPRDDEERVHLFESVGVFLCRAAGEHPLLLVIDDLHRADRASLLLLRSLAPRLPRAGLVIVGTYRDAELDDSRRELFAGLAAFSERLELRGLQPAEVAALAGSLTGATPSPEHAAALHGRTNGNPLLVRELVRHSHGGGDAAQLPEGVCEVIQRRLDRLPAPCVALLGLAAVIGPRFRTSLLRASSGLTGEHLAACLREAAAARLLEEVPGPVQRWRFVPTLVADVLVQALPGERRRELHAAVGRAIEEHFRDDLEPRLAQVAGHYRLAGERAEPGRALEYATRAGHRAARQLAYAEAADHFTQALELPDAATSLDPARRCELMLAQADARMAAGQAAIARDVYERAAGLARSIGAAELLARAALGVGVVTTARVSDQLETRLLVEALDVVDAGNPVRTRLLGRLARALHSLSSPERSRALSDQAIAAARRVGDPAILASVRYDGLTALASISTAQDGLATCDEVIRLAGLAGDQELAFQGRQVRMGYLMEQGDVGGLRTELAVCDSLTREPGLQRHAWTVLLVRASLAVLAGRLDEAERLAGEGLRVGLDAGHPHVGVYHAAIVMMVRSLQGRLVELEDALRGYVAGRPDEVEWRSTLALMLCDAGRDDEARREFEILAVDDFAALSRGVPRPHLLATLARTCAALGDERGAALLYPLLAPHGDRCIQIGLTAIDCMGSASYCLGLLSATMGRWDEALRHFEAAIEMNVRIGAWPFVANCRLQAALVLRVLGGAAALERAAEQRRRADQVAGALGIRLWRGIPETSPSGAPDMPLSSREWEVACLVAEGLRNGEIAARLFISKRTVESHVDHIWRKLGLDSRAELMSWVLQRRPPAARVSSR